MEIETVRKAKHRQIYEYFREGIVAGKFTAGQRLPSETVLCSRFETSRPTVARAMRELETAGFVQRRVGSGTYIRLDKSVGSRLFGLLIPGLGSTEIFEPICAEIAGEMQACNYGLLWGNASPHQTDDQDRAARQLCRQYIEQRVGGVFFAPIELSLQMEETNHEIADLLTQAGVPVVLLDRDLESYPRRSKFDLVGIDNRRAGCLLTGHLLNLGCRRVAFLARPTSAPTVGMRVAGWRDALVEADIQPERSWLWRGDPADLEFVRQMVEASRPEAVVCANDVTAARLMQGLSKLGHSVPQDIRVVGMDDARHSDLLGVPLTTLRQPCRELGVAAFAAMLQRIERPSMPARDILLDCELIVRQSCGGGA